MAPPVDSGRSATTRALKVRFLPGLPLLSSLDCDAEVQLLVPATADDVRNERAFIRRSTSVRLAPSALTRGRLLARIATL